MHQNIHTRFNLQIILAACVMIGTLVMSCRNVQNESNNPDPTAYRPPVTRPFEFTEPKQIEWEVTDPDSIAPPKTYPLDIDKMPSQPFSINEFKPLIAPMNEFKLDWENLPLTQLQFDTAHPTFRKSIIQKPLVTKMQVPNVVSGTTSGLLQLSQVEGLPSNEIKSIIQNEDGTYWIATFDGGLCLYNGEYLYTYDYKLLYDIVLDQQGKLWVATGSGIYVLDFKKNIQTHFAGNALVSDLFCDSENNIWCVVWQRSIVVIDSEMKHVRRNKTSDFNRAVRIMEDRDHHIWIGHNDHISVILPNRKQFKTIGNTEDVNVGFVAELFEDHAGYVWIDAMRRERGLLRISLKDQVIHSLGHENGFYGSARQYVEDDKDRLWIIQDDTTYILSADRLQTKKILTNGDMGSNSRMGYAICDDQGSVWIGTQDKGIILINSDGALPEHLDRSNGLIGSAIWSMEEDSRGHIWLGTPRGLNIYNPSRGTIKAIDNATLKNPSNSPNIAFIKEFEKDKIFVDGIWGFNIIDRVEKRMTRYIEKQNIATRIFEAIIDEDGTYWLATLKGLAVYNPELNGLKSIPDTSAQLACERVRCIVDDGLGQYWLGTTNGLVMINPEKNTIQHLREKEGLCNNNITKMMLREDSKLWVITFNGVAIIDPVNRTITNLGEEEGLVPDETYDLVEKDGEIFIGTVNGLVWVKMPTEPNPQWEFYNYAVAQGFPSNDYKRASGLVRNNGQMWFGTSPDHKLTILTQDPTIDTTACPLQITSISVMDEDVSFDRLADVKSTLKPNDTLWYDDGRQYYLKHTLPMDSGYVVENNIQWNNVESRYRIPSGLKLPYHQNYVRFNYSNLCAIDRDKISYRYLLEGKENQWTYSGDEAESKNYFNLKPGGYTFKVSSKRGLSKWSPPAELSFHITPPWWRTWWAYLGYALLAIGGVWAIVQYRSRRLQRENRLLEEKVSHRTKKLRESINSLKETQAQLIHSEKMASLGELTAGIAHEIQNPLNFVNNFSEVNVELTKELEEEIEKGDMEEAKAIAKDIKENEEKIMYHGKRAESIVKGMLQHSRSSSGEKSLTDINALADEYLRLAFHGFRAKDKSFNSKFETDFDETIEKINVVPQEIGRVMLNLITNAFHAVREKSLNGEAKEGYQPTVTVKTEKQDGQVLIEVSDNGSGMPAEIKNKIFQPFFTTKPTGEGTGLGLSMSFDIIKLHGGKISVDTVEGEGTTFYIILPITNPK